MEALPGHLPIFHVGAGFLIIRVLRDLGHPPITRGCGLGRGRCLGDGCRCLGCRRWRGHDLDGGGSRCRGLGLVRLSCAPFAVHGAVEPSGDEQGFRHIVLAFAFQECQQPQRLDGVRGEGQGDAPGFGGGGNHGGACKEGAPMEWGDGFGGHRAAMVSGCLGAGVTSPTRWADALVLVTTTRLCVCVRGCWGAWVMKKPPRDGHDLPWRGCAAPVVMVLFYVIGNCRRLGSRWCSARRLPVMGGLS